MSGLHCNAMQAAIAHKSTCTSHDYLCFCSGDDDDDDDVGGYRRQAKILHLSIKKRTPGPRFGYHKADKQDFYL